MCNDFTNSLIQFKKTNIKKKYQRLTHDKLLLSMPPCLNGKDFTQSQETRLVKKYHLHILKHSIILNP
jgi:hypothetical protein